MIKLSGIEYNLSIKFKRLIYFGLPIWNFITFINVIRLCNTLRRLKFRHNISGLQLYHLMRPLTFLIVSIVFTKTLSVEQVVEFEMFMFIGGALTFFWVTGIIQSLLTLYNNNRTYHKSEDNGTAKSPESFQRIYFIVFFQYIPFYNGPFVKKPFFGFSQYRKCSISESIINICTT